MNALREQISCLQEKNRTLEAHLTAPEEPADGAESSGERVEIRVLRSPESSSSQVGQQIELRVTVRVKCDPVGLLLRILGRLKAMGNLSLVSMETRGFSRHGNPFGLAILKFQIEVRTIKKHFPFFHWNSLGSGWLAVSSRVLPFTRRDDAAWPLKAP